MFYQDNVHYLCKFLHVHLFCLTFTMLLYMDYVNTFFLYRMYQSILREINSTELFFFSYHGPLWSLPLGRGRNTCCTAWWHTSAWPSGWSWTRPCPASCRASPDSLPCPGPYSSPDGLSNGHTKYKTTDSTTKPLFSQKIFIPAWFAKNLLSVKWTPKTWDPKILINKLIRISVPAWTLDYEGTNCNLSIGHKNMVPRHSYQQFN